MQQSQYQKDAALQGKAPTYYLPPHKRELAGIPGEVVSTLLGKNTCNSHNTRKMQLCKEKHLLTTSPLISGNWQEFRGRWQVPFSAKIHVTGTITERCGFVRKSTYLLPPPSNIL
jgi:hypothetical protein